MSFKRLFDAALEVAVVLLWALAAMAAGRALVDDERQHASVSTTPPVATAAPAGSTVAAPRPRVAEPVAMPRRLARDDVPTAPRL